MTTEETKVEKKTEEKPVEKAATPVGAKVAVIRIRGIINVNKGVQDTMQMLGLYKKNCCAVVNGDPGSMGMIRKVKDYVTWGEVSDASIKLLEKKKVKDKNFFRLHPPLKGYGRKGIKVPFVKGGALGYRADKINDLIGRMVQ